MAQQCSCLTHSQFYSLTLFLTNWIGGARGNLLVKWVTLRLQGRCELIEVAYLELVFGFRSQELNH